MIRTSLSLVSAALLAACAPESDPPANQPSPAAAEPVEPEENQPESAPPQESEAQGPNILTAAGLGDILIGKPPPASLTEHETQISDECRTMGSPAYPDVYVMTDGTTVRRITLMRDTPVRTSRGIGTGASEAEVRAAYPQLAETLHDYVGPPAKNLTFTPDGSDSGIRFEIDGDGKATLIHAGQEPFLSYSEGCA